MTNVDADLSRILARWHREAIDAGAESAVAMPRKVMVNLLHALRELDETPITEGVRIAAMQGRLAATASLIEALMPCDTRRDGLTASMEARQQS